MLNENENMDELFRKAAEDYPLRLEPQDWDKVAATYGKAPVASKFTFKKRYLVSLLLLLTAGTAGFFVYNKNKDGIIAATPSNSNKTNQEIRNNENLPSAKVIAAVAPSNNNKVKDEDVVTARNTTSTPTTASNVSKSVFARQLSYNPRIAAPFRNKIVATSAQSNSKETTATNTENELEQASINTDPIETLVAATNEEKNENINIAVGEKVAIKVENTDTSKVGITEITALSNTKNKKPINKKHFYYGLSSTLNLSTVKHQAMVSPMFGLGILAGISLNKSISLETGVQLSSHKYFSTGDYFKPKQGVMPTNMKVEDMIGRVNTIDLPLALKYNFTSLNKNIFATGGFSNTIITSEHNIYDVTINGQSMSTIGDYNKTKFFPVSSLNFSVGYQKQIGKNFRAQAEPYIQIPLRGTGIGYMPVTNFGLRFAFLKAK